MNFIITGGDKVSDVTFWALKLMKNFLMFFSLTLKVELVRANEAFKLYWLREG